MIEMIYGPPGTGKTTYLKNILLKLMDEKGIDYIRNNTAFVSFTKAAIFEMKNRLEIAEVCKYFRTLHSLGFKLLNLKLCNVVEKKDYKYFGSIIGKKFFGHVYDTSYNTNDDVLLFLISLFKNNRQRAEEFLNDKLYNINYLEYLEVAELYKKYKDNFLILDYDDMLIKCIEQNVKCNEVETVLLDEAQDLTCLQWNFFKTVFSGAKNIFIAGDDDQAVYEFAGADVSYFIHHYADKKTYLSETFRLNRDVIDKAATILEKINDRVKKPYYTNKLETNSIHYINSIEELINTSILQTDANTLILTRTNYLLDKIKKFLIDLNIYFVNKDKTLSIKQKIIKAIESYNAFSHSKDDNLKKDFQAYLKDKDDLSIDWRNNFKNINIEYYDYFIQHSISFVNINLKLNTIHGSKGAEEDNIILFLELSKNIASDSDIEHRIFYTGITRAKKKVYLVLSENRRYVL